MMQGASSRHTAAGTGSHRTFSAGAGSGTGKGELRHWRADLIKAIGLAYDPFSSGVSEKDLAPDFGSIYVDLQPGLLAALQRPEAGCLFADYGMGKTATRIALEYALRLARSPVTLCTTYTPLITMQLPGGEQSPAELFAAISTELRIDLLIQYLERLPEREAHGAAALVPAQREALLRQARALPARLLKPLRAALRDESPERSAAFWRGLRPVVRYVAPDAHWHDLLALVQGAARSPVEAPAWSTTIADVRSLGFEQMMLLVDAVDTRSFSVEAYLEVIRPLLIATAELANQQIFVKYFLPLEMKPLLKPFLDQQQAGLTPLRAIATIDTISSNDLDLLLKERFEAAGTSSASFRSLDWLGESIDESIQARLVALAAGSPRRLIELASALIDFHSLNGFRQAQRTWLTAEEWYRFLAEHAEAAISPWA